MSAAADGPAAISGDGAIVGNFHLETLIGKGAFANVYRATDVETGDVVAVKQFQLKDINAEVVDVGRTGATVPRMMISREVRLLRDLRHPNIIKIIDVIGASTKADGQMNIVLEYAEQGSLAQRLKRDGPFAEPAIAAYLVQILHGLCYLHSKSIVHCDIKCANILVTHNNEVKLTDFGVSTNLSMGGVKSAPQVTGTPNWMSPEVIEMKDDVTTAADIWSVGSTVMEMLNGEPPFSKMNPLAAMYRIVTEEPVVPDGFSPELRVFMHRCWKKIPLKRATARELLRDPFLMLRHSSPVELSPERLIRVRLERLGDASLEKMASSISIHGANTPTKRSTDSEGHVGSTGSGTGVNTVPTVGYNFEQRLASLMDPAKDPFDFVFDALANDNGLITPDNLRHLICALGYHVPNGLAHVNAKPGSTMTKVQARSEVQKLPAQKVNGQFSAENLDTVSSIGLSLFSKVGAKLSKEETEILSAAMDRQQCTLVGLCKH